MRLFETDADYEACLQTLVEAQTRVGLELFAICQRPANRAAGGLVRNFFQRVDCELIKYLGHAAAVARNVFSHEALFRRSNMTFKRRDSRAHES